MEEQFNDDVIKWQHFPYYLPFAIYWYDAGQTFGKSMVEKKAHMIQLTSGPFGKTPWLYMYP